MLEDLELYLIKTMNLHLGLKISLFIAEILGIKKIKISSKKSFWIHLTAVLYCNVHFVFFTSMFLLYFSTLVLKSSLIKSLTRFMSLKFPTKVFSEIRFISENVWVGLTLFMLIYNKIYAKNLDKCLKDTCSFIKRLPKEQRNKYFVFTFVGYLLSLFYICVYHTYKCEKNVKILQMLSFSYATIYFYTSVHLLFQACLFWSLTEHIMSAADSLKNKAINLEELQRQWLLMQNDYPYSNHIKNKILSEIQDSSFAIQKVLGIVFSYFEIPISLIFITNLIYPVNETILLAMNLGFSDQVLDLISCIIFNFMLLCSSDAVAEKVRLFCQF